MRDGVGVLVGVKERAVNAQMIPTVLLFLGDFHTFPFLSN